MPDILKRPYPATATINVDPVIVVVVPIFRHSVLLSEAIDSVLDQRANVSIRIILVNDGCPHQETDQVCRDYALAYPDRITYLHKANGGLSDARNYGIRYALAAWPRLEAIYMLDADNRLRPDALGNAFQALRDHPDAGWIYPNIDMFGLRWAGDYGGDYSVLIHTMMNICEAGSLIRRSVFDAGVFFDTSFKSGFEDWDFFLTAARAGFRGRNIDNFGFLYRKRAESMLADSERDAEAIRAAMRLKHKDLFSPRALLALEQAEAPRYAILLSDRNQVLLTTDPDSDSARLVPVEQFEQMWWRTQTDNSHHHVPPILVVTHSAILDNLRAAGLLHGLLWTMERRITQKPFVALELQSCNNDRIAWSEEDVHGIRELNATMLMVRPQLLGEVIRDATTNWISGITAQPCNVPAQVLHYELPEAFFPPRGTVYANAAHDLLMLCTKLRASPMCGAINIRWDWREPDIPWRGRTHEIVRTPTLANAAYPRGPGQGRNIGFILPLAEFGGVERVALNTARALKKAGWRPHLFIIDTNGCAFGLEWQDVFDSVTFLADPNFSTWGPAQTNYIGTDISDWSRWGDHRDAVAMLAWLDVAVNFHGGAISGLMGRLRKLGVKTAISLHLNDHSPVGRQVGNTYLGLAFEHAYDLFLPCSHQMADWCHAMGVPDDKIITVLNAPSFERPVRRLNWRPEAKKSAGRKIRAMYLGRLDRQKGLERLIGIVDATSAAKMNVEWRLIGKQVMAWDAPPLPDRIARMIEPSLTTPEALEKAFAWADVLILPSYYEGLPLTILEAMRAGVIPIATDAGAVTEVVRQWENGVVLSQTETVSEALSALMRLADDPDLVRRLSTQARADMQGRDWHNAVKPLIEKLILLKSAKPSPNLILEDILNK